MKKGGIHIKPDQLSGGLLFLFGLFLILQARELAPEAKLIPMLVACLIIVFSLALMIQSFRLKHLASLSTKLIQQQLSKRLLWIILLTLAYMFILPIIGFEIAAFFYILLVIGIIERRFLWANALLSAIVSISLILIFSLGMNLRIPLLVTKLFNL